MDCLNIFKDEQEYAQAISEHPEIFFDKPTVTAITEELKPTKCYIEPLVTGKTGRPDAAGLKEIDWGGNDIMRLYRNLDTFVDVPQSDKDLKPMDMSKIADAKGTMKYCPYFDTSNVTDMNRMFEDCKSLTTVPLFDTSKVTNMSEMFSGCTTLTTVPQFDTSNVTDMGDMFGYCSSLTSVPEFDTSKVTNMEGMFYYCSSLTSVPQFDTSKVTDMINMINMGVMVRYFDAEGKITHDISTDKITLTKDPSYNDLIYKAKYFCLQHQPSGGAGWVEGVISNVLDNGDSFTISIGSWHGPKPEKQVHKGFELRISNSKLSNLGGFIGLKCNLDLSDCPKLTHESLMNVINNAANLKSLGKSATLTLGTTNLAKLTTAERKVATDKGWTLA